MKRLALAVCVLLAACSRPSAPAPETSVPQQPANGPFYDLELSYGSRGALYLTVEEPGKPKERYLLRLAVRHLGLGDRPDGGQVFWADQWPADGEKDGVIKVLKDPFLVLWRDGRFYVARLPHMLKDGETEHHLQSVRGLFKGDMDVEYGPKDAASSGPHTKVTKPELVPVRKFDFKLPSKDLM